MTKAQPAWLTEAATHIGFHEGPNNANPFGDHYRIPNQPWCALFVSYCCWKVGKPLPSMQPGMPNGYAGVWYGMQWAKANGFWRPSDEAQPGDAIVYGWAGAVSSPSDMHTGLIVSAGAVGALGRTIEGNRSDQVERQTFTVGESVVLGTIALTKILAPKIIIRPKPDPQPRHPDHPANSGPTPLKHTTDAEALTQALGKSKHPKDKAGRGVLKTLRRAINRVLRRKVK